MTYGIDEDLELTEKITLEKKLTLEKTFTTHPKHKRRGHSPVRGRCLEYIGILKEQGYTQTIPLENAQLIFQTEMGIMDRASLKAYFGTQAQCSTRKIRQRATYPSGTVSFKNIELTQEIKPRKGYLEILGLVNIEKKGHTYFMNIKHDGLVPEMGYNNEEDYSIDSFSLSHIHQGKECEKTVSKVVSPPNIEIVENKNRE